jgi:hypothetical protein
MSNDFIAFIVAYSFVVSHLYHAKKISGNILLKIFLIERKFNAIMISFIVGFMMDLLVQAQVVFCSAFYCFDGFDFHASANAKMVNLATNFGSMLFMIKENHLGNCFANGC